MKRVAVFIDYDILIRHFIHSGAFRQLEQAYDVTYIFRKDPEAKKPSIYTDLASLGLKRVVELAVHRTRIAAWDMLYNLTILRYQRGQENLAARKSLMELVHDRRVVRYWTLLALPGLFPLVRWAALQRIGTLRPLEELIDRLQPDLILHPSVLAGYFINDLLAMTRRRRIPFVVLMNSWDNPTSKAMVTGVPDRLVVWGEMSKRYAMQYLRVPEERVACFGAAQFQLYRTPPTESLQAIRRESRVPDGKRIVLYAGASKGAHETHYLQMLEEGIERGDIPDCHVIYRPHPWRGSLGEGEANFFDLSWKHVTMDPHMEDYYRRQAKVYVAGIEMADYPAFHRLLHLADAVISPLSTALLEAAILGKPTVMFFPREDLHQRYGAGTRLALGLAHFVDFWGVEGINVCTERGAFYAVCRQLLAQAGDPKIAEGLQAHAARFVVMDGPTYGERLVELAHRLTAGRQEPTQAAMAPEEPAIVGSVAQADRAPSMVTRGG